MSDDNNGLKVGDTVVYRQGTAREKTGEIILIRDTHWYKDNPQATVNWKSGGRMTKPVLLSNLTKIDDPPGKATEEHIRIVRRNIEMVTAALYHRGRVHDASKLEEPELSAFHTIQTERTKVKYPSPEYDAMMASQEDAINHHYQQNDHHSEHFELLEQWRDNAGYEGAYQISNKGRVRSLSRQVVRPGPTGNLTKKESLLTPNLTPKGYLRVQFQVDKKPSNRLVHVLVAEAFLGERPDPAMEVNHENGIKTDNRVGNLKWVTRSRNLQHAYDTGLRKGNAKYIVRCDEHDIETVGMTQMATALNALGIPATAAGIWGATIGDNTFHCGLAFEAWPIAEAPVWHGIDDMSLLSIMEMVCDWYAAAQRYPDFSKEKFAESLTFNFERFGIFDQLGSIITNTCKELGWIPA